MHTRIPVVAFGLTVLLVSGSAQSKLPTIHSKSYQLDSIAIQEFGDRIDYMCSLGCAIGWKVTSTSQSRNRSTNRYPVHNLDDGRLSTFWVPAGSGDGIAQSITFTFPPNVFVLKDKDDSVWVVYDSVNVNGFRIVNGDVTLADRWRSKGRVKSFRVIHNQTPVMDIAVDDNMSIQDATTDEPFYIKPGDIVVVRITSIYPGSKQRKLAITELVPLGAH